MLQLIFPKQSYLAQHCPELHRRPGRRHQQISVPQLTRICAVFLLAMNASFAANDVSGGPHGTPSAQAAEELGAVLLKIEQEVSAGHAFSPPGDNALSIWPQAIENAFPVSPEGLKVLTDFTARVRSRADGEKAAGRIDVSTDFTIFEELANKLLEVASAEQTLAAKSPTGASKPVPEGHAAPPPVTEATSPDARSNLTSSDALIPGSSQRLPAADAAPALIHDIDRRIEDLPTRIQTGAYRARPDSSPGLPAADAASAQPSRDIPVADTSPAVSLTNMNAGHPEPSAGKPALAIEMPATLPVGTARERLAATIYASRGDAMLAIKDISAARKFYEYAASAGSARAAAALAGTYDPAILINLGAVGVRPDPVLAADWYRKAAALGDRDAETRLHTLGTLITK
jgi:hypothetical protein